MIRMEGGALQHSSDRCLSCNVPRIVQCSEPTPTKGTKLKRFWLLMLHFFLVRSLCQICRSLSLQERCPGCTTRRCIYFAPQTWTRDTVIPKTMEARNSQNTRLTKKKSSCRILIVFWALLLGYTFSPHWNPPRPLLHAMQPHEPMGRNHLGQCTALSNRRECERYWEARTKITENLLRSFSITTFLTTRFVPTVSVLIFLCTDW
jgi:hypothetical protein